MHSILIIFTSHPPQLLPEPPIPSCPLPISRSLLYIMIIYITYWVWLVLSICIRMWGHPLGYGQSSRDHTLKENWFSLPSSHQLSIVPHLKVGARSPSLFHVGMMIGLIFPRSYVGSHNYEFISQGSCCVHVTSVLRNLWLLCSICTPSSTLFPEYCREGTDICLIYCWALHRHLREWLYLSVRDGGLMRFRVHILPAESQLWDQPQAMNDLTLSWEENEDVCLRVNYFMKRLKMVSGFSGWFSIKSPWHKKQHISSNNG